MREIGASRLWDKEERKMRRWVWRALLTVTVLAALTMGASAAEVTVGNVKYETDTGTVLGPAKSGITSADIKAEITVGGTAVSITQIARNAFENCSTLTSVTIPSGITVIGSHAFASSGLSSVTIPGTVSTINPNTFEACTNLNEVTLSENVTSIGEDAFNGCSNLEKIHFPKTVTGIDSRAFAGCTKLKSVALPEGYSPIKTGTFSNCANLTSVYIPGNVRAIEVNAFSGCSKLKILHYGGTDAATLTQNDATPREVHLVLPVTTTTKQPTCQEEGRRTTSITCDSCKGQVIYSEDRLIERKPHTEEEIPEIPASCTQTGSSGGKRCAVCKTVLVRPTVTPMTPHKEKAIPNTPATCTAPGSQGGKQCEDCGEITEQPTIVEQLKHKTDDAHKDTTGKVTKESTCTEKGEKTFLDTCIHCNQPVIERIEEIGLIDHKHTKQQTEPYTIREGNCKYSGISVPHLICDVCGAVEACSKCDAIKETVKNGADLTDDQKTHLETHGEITVTPAPGHKIEKIEDKEAEGYKAPTCTEAGHIIYKEVECSVCHTKVTPDPEDPEALGHDLTDPVDKPNAVAATCKEEGEDWLNFRECKRDGCDYEEKTVVKKKGAHTWGTPESTSVDEDGNPVEDKDPTCGDEGAAYVIVVCSVCGETEHRKIELPATGKHTWGEWKTEDGKETRTCSVCGKTDTRTLSPTDPDNPDNPDNPDKPTDPDNPSKPEETTYKVDVVQASNGTTSVSRSTAKAGDLVTVTVSPSSGYVLDMIRVIGGSQLVSLTNLGNNQYRFTMPSANVEVRATYDRTGSDYSGNWTNGFGNSGSGDRSDPRRTTDVMPVQIQEPSVGPAGASERLFQDIPTDHWAAGEINWASQMGYMNGTGNRFNPDGAISQQQMWMVLARLTGNQPANMAEARRWAELGGYADGSSPIGPVKRHQLVTALYRCARLSGRAGRTTTSLAGYPDSRTVPAVAREAFTWALSTGVVSGDAEGRLKPNDSITRAQFAVILYRYSTRT